MKHFSYVALLLSAVVALGGCSSDDDTEEPNGLASATVLDLEDVKDDPDSYEWFDFRPNVKKLILAGAAETEHIAILWYTVEDGAVGLHYHSKTESVYVIDGTQTDGKGVYPTGTVYFNPPDSGHAISDSSGFFLLAYASPPDFENTDAIQEYTPVRIDTEDDLTDTYDFEDAGDGASVYTPALDSEGGIGAEFIEVSESGTYEFTGNYVLVLEGTCSVNGVELGEDRLVVGKELEPAPYTLAGAGETCLALGLSF